MDDDTLRDLRWRKLCFTCQEPWAPGHRCAAGKAHYIEVFSDSEGEENAYEEIEGEASAIVQRGDHPPPPPPGAGGEVFSLTGGVLISEHVLCHFRLGHTILKEIEHTNRSIEDKPK